MNPGYTYAVMQMLGSKKFDVSSNLAQKQKLFKRLYCKKKGQA